MAGAQAADLPVKAKPVEYVKICSLYGVGFYYIPGTDMCIKIGGWVRAEYAWGVNGSSTQTYGQNAYLDNRSTNNSWWRVRGYITADARNQTEYGTVRGYIAVGISTDDLGNGEQQTFNANRAFIQWDIGLDVAYTKVQSANSSDGRFLGPFPTGTNTLARNISDQDNWQARFRVHRDFYP